MSVVLNRTEGFCTVCNDRMEFGGIYLDLAIEAMKRFNQKHKLCKEGS